MGVGVGVHRDLKGLEERWRGLRSWGMEEEAGGGGGGATSPETGREMAESAMGVAGGRRSQGVEGEMAGAVVGVVMAVVRSQGLGERWQGLWSGW